VQSKILQQLRQVRPIPAPAPHPFEFKDALKRKGWSTFLFKDPTFARVHYLVNAVTKQPLFNDSGILRLNYHSHPVPVEVFVMWGMPEWQRVLSWNHEMGHVYGIMPHCLGNHPWCIMAEEAMIGFEADSIIGKTALLKHQLSREEGRGQFCEACTMRLIQHGVDEGFFR
jgi:hypothetical protein